MKSPNESSAVAALSGAGTNDSSNSGSRGSTAGIWARWPRCSRRSSKRGSWRRHAVRLAMARRTGARASAEPIWTSVTCQPRGKEIHVIADNLWAHNSAPVKEFLEAHPKVHLHFAPTYSSWLNQVELWFGKIERDVIARGCVHLGLRFEEKTHARHPPVQ